MTGYIVLYIMREIAGIASAAPNRESPGGLKEDRPNAPGKSGGAGISDG